MNKAYFKSDSFLLGRQRLELSIITFLKWMLISVLTGAIIGIIGAVFHEFLSFVGNYRSSNSWLLFMLPFAGLIIVFLYEKSGCGNNRGTNLVIDAIQSNEKVPARVAPLIIIATLLTHLCGGSAGREGAALQIGGSLGNGFARILKFDEKDTRIVIMCGMSACFASLFGTPIAAAIFSMEVISVGIMYYAALLPCTVSALIGAGIAQAIGVHATHYDIATIPEFNVSTGGRMIIMAMFFAIASVLLCIILHKANHMYNHFFSNPYIRIFVAGLLVILLRYIVGSTDYLGAGADVIARAFVTRSVWCAFLLKMVFTAITLGGGFKGGEIVPTLFVGATLGSFLAPIFGLPIDLCAACGMVAVFCGVTNCPLTSLLLSIEMFGADSIHFCIIAIAVGYLMSGYYSLYNSQKIMYSKYKTEYVNRHTS